MSDEKKDSDSSEDLKKTSKSAPASSEDSTKTSKSVSASSENLKNPSKSDLASSEDSTKISKSLSASSKNLKKSGEKKELEDSGDDDTGEKAGVYKPLDDPTPPIEASVGVSDTVADRPEKKESREEAASSQDLTALESGSDPQLIDEDSCAEEGGVPHDILALYGGNSSYDENEAEEFSGDVEEELAPPYPPEPEEELEEEPNTVNLEAPEELVRRVTKRFSAKLIDFLIAAILYQVPGIVGPVAAVAYILLSDGISGGSLGKRAAGGLRVVSTIKAGEACDFRDSILRNSIFGVLAAAFFLLGWIPYFGKLAVFVAALAVVAYEASLLYKVREGTRIGDTLAGTRVTWFGGNEPDGGDEAPKPAETGDN